MAKKIAFFNHKGGVSKTTTTFHIGWMLAKKGKKVILVDADPQCNLTGLILDYKYVDLEEFYKDKPNQNLRDGLAPAFTSQPKLISPVECIEVNDEKTLLLLAGHIKLAENDVTLGIAQELSGSLHALRNLPGSINFLLDRTAEKYNADYILIDMSPSLSSINQNLLMISDYFIVPTAPDYYSVMAIDSLTTIMRRWDAWSQKAQESPVLRDAEYKFPNRRPLFLGTVIQKFRLKYSKPSKGFQHWINEINKIVTTKFVPNLKELNMLCSDSVYQKAGLKPNYCLAEIPDFNTLIATSQQKQTPVFLLSDKDIPQTGVVLDRQLISVKYFYNIFEDLTNKILEITNDSKCTPSI